MAYNPFILQNDYNKQKKTSEGSMKGVNLTSKQNK